MKTSFDAWRSGAERIAGTYRDMKAFHETHAIRVQCLHQVLHAENLDLAMPGAKQVIWDFLFFSNFPLSRYFMRKRMRQLGIYSRGLLQDMEAEMLSALRRALIRYNPYNLKDDGEYTKFGTLLFLAVKTEMRHIGKYMSALDKSDYAARLRSRIERIAIAIGGATRGADQVSDHEIAEKMGTSEEQVARYRRQAGVTSLWSEDDRSYQDFLPSNESFGTQDSHAELAPFVAQLSLRRRLLFTLRMGWFSDSREGEGYTLAELGALFGLTRERVRQLLGSAEDDLKEVARSGYKGEPGDAGRLESEVLLVELGVNPVAEVLPRGLERTSALFQLLVQFSPAALRRIAQILSTPYPFQANNAEGFLRLLNSQSLFSIGPGADKRVVYPSGTPTGSWEVKPSCDDIRCAVTHAPNYATVHDLRASSVRFTVLSSEAIINEIPLAQYMFPPRWQLVLQSEEMDSDRSVFRVRHHPLGDPVRLSEGVPLEFGRAFSRLMKMEFSENEWKQLRRQTDRTPSSVRGLQWEDTQLGTLRASMHGGGEARRLLNQIASDHHSVHRVNHRPFDIHNNRLYLIVECSKGALLFQLLPRKGLLFETVGRFSVSERAFVDLPVPFEDAVTESLVSHLHLGEDFEEVQQLLQILHRGVGTEREYPISKTGAVRVSGRRGLWDANAFVGKERFGEQATVSLVSARSAVDRAPWLRYVFSRGLRFGLGETLVQIVLRDGEIRYYRVLSKAEREGGNVLSLIPTDFMAFLGQLVLDDGKLSGGYAALGFPDPVNLQVGKNGVVRVGGYRSAESPYPIPIKVSVKEEKGSWLKAQLLTGAQMKAQAGLAYWPGSEADVFLLLLAENGREYVFSLKAKANKSIHFLRIVYRREVLSDGKSEIYVGRHASVNETEDGAGVEFTLRSAIGDALEVTLLAKGKKQLFIREPYRAVIQVGDEHTGKKMRLRIVRAGDAVSEQAEIKWLLKESGKDLRESPLLRGELESGEVFFWTVEANERNPLKLIRADFYNYVGRILATQQTADPTLLGARHPELEAVYSNVAGVRVANFKLQGRKTVAAKIRVDVEKGSTIQVKLRSTSQLRALYPDTVVDSKEEMFLVACASQQCFIFSPKLDPKKCKNTIQLKRKWVVDAGLRTQNVERVLRNPTDELGAAVGSRDSSYEPVTESALTPILGSANGMTAGVVELAMEAARQTEKSVTAQYLRGGYSLMKPETRGHFLDLGAGNGTVAGALSGLFSRHTLVERMESHQATLNSLGLENLRVFDLDYFEFLWGNHGKGPFDAILFAQSLYGDVPSRRRILLSAISRLPENGLLAIVTNDHSLSESSLSSIKQSLGVEIKHKPNQDIVRSLSRGASDFFYVEIPLEIRHTLNSRLEMGAVLMSYLPASARDLEEEQIWAIVDSLETDEGSYVLRDNQSLIWISPNPFLINQIGLQQGCATTFAREGNKTRPDRRQGGSQGIHPFLSF
ncbi:MAG: sigma factor-like helix-turn-helix DNA-binding protein [Bdellovibrionota bacterium]